MKLLSALLLSVGFALSGAALAQDKQEGAKKAPSAAQKKQQARMRDCSERAGERKGRERQEFMSTCLKGDAPKAQKMTAQQQRMAKCNREAGAKGIKGDARKKFMSECLGS